MSQFLILCTESRIETPQSFYSSFILGPFHPSESITIATALRRSLLSELPGLGILSVQIEGAAHEYSNLPGIRDSVLDILLNLREIGLKKSSKNLRPQIGYLKARGPGIILAEDLCFPPFIQCVDPKHHIATLAEDGVLNMKFIIAEGNNYIKGKPKMVIDLNQFKKNRLILKKLYQVFKNSSILKNYYCYLKKKVNKKKIKGSPWPPAMEGDLTPSVASNHWFKNFILNRNHSKQTVYSDLLKKRTDRLMTDKNVLSILAPTYKPLRSAVKAGFKGKIKKESKNLLLNKSQTRSSLNLSQAIQIKKNNKTLNLLNVDAVFNPILNVNYIIEVNEHKILENLFDKTNKIEQNLEIIKTKPLFNQFFAINGGKRMKQSKLLLNKSSFCCLKKLLKYQMHFERFQNLTNKPNFIEFQRNGSLENQHLDKFSTHKKLITNKSQDLKVWSNELKKDNIFHNNIIFEVWTNGSLHPREAIYEGFKYLIHLFSKLKKIKVPKPILRDQAQNSDLMNELRNNLNDVVPLNQTTFLGKYTGVQANPLAGRSPEKKMGGNKEKLTAWGFMDAPSHGGKSTKKMPSARKSSSDLERGWPSFRARVDLAEMNNRKTTSISSNQEPKKVLNKTALTKLNDLSSLKITSRALIALNNKNIKTIGDLIQLTTKDLLNIPSIGKKSVQEIQKMLVEIGLNFKND